MGVYYFLRFILAVYTVVVHFVIMQADDIIQFIPQRTPFVFVDAILNSEEKSTITSFSVKQDNLFIIDGHLSESALVENVAQTAAAGIGQQVQLTGEKVTGGYIGGIRNLKVNRLPKVGDELRTETSIQHRILNAVKIHGSVSVNGEEIASCELQIFLQSN